MNRSFNCSVAVLVAALGVLISTPSYGERVYFEAKPFQTGQKFIDYSRPLRTKPIEALRTELREVERANGLQRMYIEGSPKSVQVKVSERDATIKALDTHTAEMKKALDGEGDLYKKHKASAPEKLSEAEKDEYARREAFLEAYKLREEAGAEFLKQNSEKIQQLEDGTWAPKIAEEVERGGQKVVEYKNPFSVDGTVESSNSALANRGSKNSQGPHYGTETVQETSSRARAAQRSSGKSVEAIRDSLHSDILKAYFKQRVTEEKDPSVKASNAKMFERLNELMENTKPSERDELEEAIESYFRFAGTPDQLLNIDDFLKTMDESGIKGLKRTLQMTNEIADYWENNIGIMSKEEREKRGLPERDEFVKAAFTNWIVAGESFRKLVTQSDTHTEAQKGEVKDNFASWMVEERNLLIRLKKSNGDVEIQNAAHNTFASKLAERLKGEHIEKDAKLEEKLRQASRDAEGENKEIKNAFCSKPKCSNWWAKLLNCGKKG